MRAYNVPALPTCGQERAESGGGGVRAWAWEGKAGVRTESKRELGMKEEEEEEDPSEEIHRTVWRFPQMVRQKCSKSGNFM